MTMNNHLNSLICDSEQSGGRASGCDVSGCSPLADGMGRQVLYQWNDTRDDYPDVCAHRLFEEQVARTPDAVAVIGRGQALSYRALNQRANQVARFLRKRGVGPETLVGVCLERSPEMVIALLGVWKAGGAYVPLDSSYPQERLSFMVSDAAVKVLLTEVRCKPLFNSMQEQAVCLDADWHTIAQEDTSNLDSGATPLNLAYVMYTSGSTGKPKGAMIHHRGLVNYLWWAMRTYRAGAGESVPVHSSISFDLTVTSLYPALLSGGQVELLAEDVGALNLLSALRQKKNRNLVKITPAHLEALSQQLRVDEIEGLTKLFVIGGENLLAEHLRVWREYSPGTRLINEYGPTETVVGCCVYEVQPEDSHNGPVPIGRPISNMRMYILDENLQPLPPGVMGEIYIGGVGVARGYLNRPDLTQERFLPDPFSSLIDARMYKTGDLGRYRDDGIIEYLGRADNQVKVNGYRIELGEIEAALASWPSAQSCVVLAREDTPGDKQLVGYLVLRGGEIPATAELQSFLKAKLPEYMVPSRFIYLDSLPLTPNGKVDRKVLPTPSLESAHTERERIRPRNATEKALAAIWIEMLKVDDVSVHDDFFDLGGRSLLAIKAMSRIRDAFQVDLPAQTLFENPTIAALADVLTKTQRTSAGTQRIERRMKDTPAPLSFAQEPLWYLHQLNPGSPVYNIVDTIYLTDTYNADALGRAVNEVVRRHEILRTSFVEVSGQPVQVIMPRLNLTVPELDLTSLPEADRELAWREVVRKEGRKAFDLSQPPLMRTSMVHWSRTEHRLLLTVHHILADEWSMEIIQQEVQQLYRAFSRDQSSPLAELPIQYADFASWQQVAMRGDVLQDQLSYWKQELAGAPTTLELPTDKPRPPKQTFCGATELFSIPSDVLEKLKLLGRQEQTTLFMTLEASFAALLYRYTGQTDILVGTPISGRTQSETEGLVGCFLNTLVLRTQFADDLGFRSLLRQVRGRALGAYTHPNVPFSQLVAALAPERDSSRSPLFQAMFVLHDTGGVSQVSKASGNHKLETGTSKFDLTLTLSESEGTLEGLIEFSTDLFFSDTIRRLCNHYVNLLQAMVHDPDEKIVKLPMLTEAEREQLLVQWNDTAQERPQELGLHQLLEQSAERNPDQVAVVFEQLSMTYGELNCRANQLAHHLKGIGVGPDVLVGIHVGRSLEMVVGILGILKAGGAYVPLDPAFPQSRLAYMVEDSRMNILLTHHNLDQSLSVRPPVIVHLDSDWNEIGKQSTESTGLPPISQTCLAYVLYTSGSTGKPKGVAIPHSAIVNFLLSMQSAPGFSEADTLLAVTTLSFDIAALELYLPLLKGGKVVIASEEEIHDPRRLMERMQLSGCTVMQATPATFRALVHAGWKGRSKLKLLCGGEPLLPDLATQLLARCDELWNMYGPTETTVWSTIHKVSSAEGQISIGKPIGNTQVYVLDPSRNLVPVGTAGELYIGGDGLARGYLNREELTRERFVPNPFLQGSRLYRTGDLARWLADGTLACLGRVDNQVKIRGFRIELGEIETVLNDHPGIRQCAVIVREDTPGDKRLFAYFEKKAGTTPDVSDLRSHLERELPSYMVPAIFIPMERLPLTPNGKIDRKSLPAPTEALHTASEHVAPSDQLEQLLAQMWARILKVKQVGVNDNFFELGGHSLLAVRLIIEVEKLCHIRLPLAIFLQAPTVSELADALRKQHWSPSWSSLVPIRPRGTRPPLFLMHSHGGNTLEYHSLSRLLDSEQPVYALQARGLDGHIPTNSSIEKMAAAYVEELRSVHPEGPYFIGGFCFGGLLALEAARLLTAAGQDVPLVFLIQSIHPQAMRFKESIRPWQRLWYRTSKRVDLELQNLSHRGVNYIADRLQFTFNHLQAKTAFALGKVKVDGDADLTHLPTHYILEALAIEHSKAASKYVPRPYDGDVVLFRASKQLCGLEADEYLGWRQTLRGNLDVIDISGHQQNLLLNPHVSLLAKELSTQLDAALRVR